MSSTTTNPFEELERIIRENEASDPDFYADPDDTIKYMDYWTEDELREAVTEGFVEGREELK